MHIWLLPQWVKIKMYHLIYTCYSKTLSDYIIKNTRSWKSHVCFGKISPSISQAWKYGTYGSFPWFWWFKVILHVYSHFRVVAAIIHVVVFPYTCICTLKAQICLKVRGSTYLCGGLICGNMRYSWLTYYMGQFSVQSFANVHTNSIVGKSFSQKVHYYVALWIFKFFFAIAFYSLVAIKYNDRLKGLYNAALYCFEIY